MTPSQWDLETLAAQLRRHSDDLALYAGFLLTTLSSALPPEMLRVEHRGGGLVGRLRGTPPAVVGVAVVLGSRSFLLRREKVGAPPVAAVQHESGGVVMRTEKLGLQEWSQQLAAGLAGYATENSAAADVLARLTLPGAL